MQSLRGVLDVEAHNVSEENFYEVIPLNQFEAQSSDGRFVPVGPDGSSIPLHFHNREKYVESALNYRLHEVDAQVRKSRFVVP